MTRPDRLPVSWLIAALLLMAGPARSDDTVAPAVEKFQRQLANKSVDRDRLRQEILTFVHGKAGTRAAVDAAGLLRQLPSPLDKLDPKNIPELDRFDWQPKELVAVIGEHRGRHGSSVSCLVYTKDGKRVISGGANGLVRIFDSATLRQQAVVGTGSGTTCLAVSHDSKTLVAGNGTGGLYVWDISGKMPVATGTFTIGTSTVYGVDISPDNKHIAAGVYDGLVHTFDLTGSKPKERTQLSGHRTAVRAVQFSPDNRTLATASADGIIRFWVFQPDSIKESNQLQAHTAAISCLTFSSRGGTLMAGCDDGTIINIAMGTRPSKRAFFKVPSGSVMWLAYSPSGQLTSSGSDGKVYVWGASTTRPSLIIQGHYGTVPAFGYSPDGRMIATGGWDWTVRQWQLTGLRATERFPLKGHWARVHRVAFSSDGSLLACASEDRTARIWKLNLPAPAQSAQLNKDNQPMYAVAFNPDGKTLATGDHGTTARLWDLARRTDLRSFPGHPTSIYHVEFTPDGNRLLTSSGKMVYLWNANTTRELFRFEGHEERVNSMAMSPDGRYVLTGTGYYQYKDGKLVTINGQPQYVDCTIRLWDLKDGRLRKEVTKLERPVSKLTFAPDGRTFACSLWERPSALWEASPEELKSKRELKNTAPWGHLHAFSPDGKYLATLGRDYRLRLTDVAADKVLKEWGLAEYIAHVSFSPDNRYLAVSIQTGPVYILRLEDPPATTP